MTAWPASPVLYEINTALWLAELSRATGGEVTLGDVPADAWDAVALPGVDAVWLMGVWERSEVGREIALASAELASSFREALPDVQDDDVVGSPYCVRRYVVDARLGGPAGLAAARAELSRRGVRLVLDHVPNHVAPDHPWLQERPDVFVHGTTADLQRAPEAFLASAGTVVARGRDPYFPPWPDVVQLDAFAPQMRDATVETLTAIGDMCDGVRCDMAMLLLNDVFSQTWGDRVGAAPAQDFWPEVLPQVRTRHPDMLFIAEAYWDMEWTLQQHGFDHCYDKRLHDRLVEGHPGPVRGHLGADPQYQQRLVRFLENHDEPRAAATLSPSSREQTAAVAIATLPGATLWHEGQFEGRRVRLPVFLTRRPDEPLDTALRAFHEQLLAGVHRTQLRTGQWCLLECTGWPDNQTCLDLLAWCWESGSRRFLVVVNLAPDAAQGRVRLPWSDLTGRSWRWTDVLDGRAFERQGDEMAQEGLFVGLDGWGRHVLALDP